MKVLGEGSREAGYVTKAGAESHLFYSHVTILDEPRGPFQTPTANEVSETFPALSREKVTCSRIAEMQKVSNRANSDAFMFSEGADLPNS